MATTIIPLALQILPYIPGLMGNVMGIIDAARKHPSTPDEVKTDLDGIAADLDALNVRIQAVPLPQ